MRHPLAPSSKKSYGCASCASFAEALNVRPILLLLAAVLALAAGVTQADARLQRAFVCWEPDNEFPVQCDDEED